MDAYKWRAKFGGVEALDARRLREMKEENFRLKKLPAEAHLDMCAQERSRGKAVALQVRREAIGRLVRENELSEHRAWRPLGLSRDSYRHPPQPSAQEEAQSQQIVAVAH